MATKDGFIGYVKTNALNSVEKELVSRDYEEPEYTNISENYTINMAWHNVSNADANSYILETIASTKGLNTIAPTWFSLAEHNYLQKKQVHSDGTSPKVHARTAHNAVRTHRIQVQNQG